MRVYISHSRENANLALRLRDKLAQHLVEAWLDLHDLPPGAVWDKNVKKAIAAARAFVFLIGPTNTIDRFQTFEWQEVVRRGYDTSEAVALIPVTIGKPELPGFLKDRRAVPLTGSPSSISTAVARIQDALSDPASSIDPEKSKAEREIYIAGRRGFHEYATGLSEREAK